MPLRVQVLAEPKECAILAREPSKTSQYSYSAKIPKITHSRPPKVHGFPAITPICHIAPITRIYATPPPKAKSSKCDPLLDPPLDTFWLLFDPLSDPRVCVSRPYNQKTPEGCDCFRGLFGGSRGKLRESPGGKLVTNREMLQILGFWALGKANLPGTLVRHCLDLIPTFRVGCFLKSTAQPCRVF